jgi:hypothetical protein
MENIILRTRAVNLRNRSDESSYELTTFQALKVKILQSSRKMAQKSKFTKNIWSILARLKQNFANKDGLINRPENEPSIDNFYKDGESLYQNSLFLLSCATVEKYCTSRKTTIIKIHDESNFQSLFKRNYSYIRETFQKNQPANLLYIGGDVIAIRDFEFPPTDKLPFQMFNYAKFPEKYHNSRAGERNFHGGGCFFEHYLNAEIRLYGHNIPEDVWKIGDNWFDNWVNYWEYEQDLWNAMFRAILEREGNIVNNSSFLPNPSFSFQMPINEIKDQRKIQDWNGISISSAKLVHLHSSRGVKNAVDFVIENLS